MCKGMLCRLVMLGVALAVVVGCRPSAVGRNDAKDAEGTASRPLVNKPGTENGQAGGVDAQTRPTEGSPMQPQAVAQGAAAAGSQKETQPGEADQASKGIAAYGEFRPPVPVKPVDAWLEGVEDSRVIEPYNLAREKLATNPNDVEARLNIAYILLSVAMSKDQTQEGSGNPLFIQASEEARPLLKSDTQLPEGADRLLGYIFYFAGCALAQEGKIQDAFAALDVAFQKDFNDLQQLTSDPKLEKLRASEDYPTKLAAWQAALTARVRSEIADQLATHKSFPFDFDVIDVNGMAHKLSDYKGKVLVVDIWGTWCPPCRAEIPSFVKLQATYGEKGFQMIGLNYEGDNSETSAEKVRKFIQEHGINYPCALGTDAIRDQVPDFEGYPTTLFIDRQGRVRLKVVGLHPYEFLEAVVTTLLDEPESSQN